MKLEKEYGCALVQLATMPDKDDLAIIDEINQAIKKDGCSISLHDAKGGVLYLALNINYATAANSRRAGRRKAYPMGLVRVGDVRRQLESKSADEVAAELGISRATLFRRLKDKDDERYL